MQVHENNLAYVPVLTPKGREAGKIHFVPGDDGIHQRAIEAKPHFLALLKPLASADITPDGKGADKRSEGLISEAEKFFQNCLTMCAAFVLRKMLSSSIDRLRLCLTAAFGPRLL